MTQQHAKAWGVARTHVERKRCRQNQNVQGVELEQLLAEKPPAGRGAPFKLPSAPKGEHKAAQDEEERDTALAAEVELVAQELRVGNIHEQDEAKAKRLQVPYHGMRRFWLSGSFTP